MTEFIAKALSERKLGLALHYPLLHAAIVGLNARRTFEFGAGGSTRVILDALSELPEIETTGRVHRSISTETMNELLARYNVPLGRWYHACGRSDVSGCERDDLFAIMDAYDLILHDGSHSAEVVAADIAWAWPRLKGNGLLLVHDTLHSYCGKEMRKGVRIGLVDAGAKPIEAITLPYGFGLTVLRKGWDDDQIECTAPLRHKQDSPHLTERLSFGLKVDD